MLRSALVLSSGLLILGLAQPSTVQAQTSGFASAQQRQEICRQLDPNSRRFKNECFRDTRNQLGPFGFLGVLFGSFGESTSNQGGVNTSVTTGSSVGPGITTGGGGSKGPGTNGSVAATGNPGNDKTVGHAGEGPPGGREASFGFNPGPGTHGMSDTTSQSGSASASAGGGNGGGNAGGEGNGGGNGGGNSGGHGK